MFIAKFVGCPAAAEPLIEACRLAKGDWAATFTYPTGANQAIDMAKSVLLDCATKVDTTVTVDTTAITPENAKSMMGN
jgi:ribose transport system substrate-binding protein